MMTETSSAPTTANGSPSVEREVALRASQDAPPGDDSIEALQAQLESARQRLQQRVTAEIEQHRTEAEQLRKNVEQLRGEADGIVTQAHETAARIIAEAKETQARTLEQTQRQVDSLLTRLSDKAGSFLERAAAEINGVQQAIAAARSGPGDEKVGTTGASTAEPQEERVVTRLIARPGATPEERNRLKARLESVPGVYAVLFGAVEDNSYEMLLAHSKSAKLEEGVLALAPEAVQITGKQDGLLEVELKDRGWLDTPASTPSAV